MPAGVPVATVALDGAQNAGILAAEILAISDKKLGSKLLALKETLRKRIEGQAKEIERRRSRIHSRPPKR